MVIKWKYLSVILVLVCGGVFGYKFLEFQDVGMASSYDVIPFYLFLVSLALAILYKKRVLLINALLVIAVFFAFEMYLITTNSGILNYEEQLGFKRYISTYAQGFKYGYDEFDNWISVPNTSEIQENIDFKYNINYNSYGLRDIELNKDDLLQKKVVVVLGDSFTEGNGTPQDSTMPKLLENILIEKLDSNYKVINAGVAGSDPVYAYKLFDTKLKQFKPEVIVLAINISDIIDIMCKKGFDRFVGDKFEYYKPPRWEYLYAISRVYRVLAVQFFKIDPYLLITESERKIRFKKAYGTVVESIHKFEETAAKINSDLVVVYSPHLFEFKNVQSKMRIDDEFESKLKCDYAEGEFNTHFIFFRDTILKYKLFDTTDLYQYYWKHDYHFKPIGYNKWAEVIAKEIPERK